MKLYKKSLATLIIILFVSLDSSAQEESHDETHESAESNRPIYKLDSQTTWPFISLLNDAGDDASTLGLEFESTLKVGKYNIKNISYFEVNQYPRPIPGQPIGNPIQGGNIEAVDGINDLLMGFWFAKRDTAHRKHHLTLGFAVSLPTASDPTLGSGKWSLGPSFDYEYENGRLFAGAIGLQLWSIGGQSDRKDVSMLMIKPFIVYNLAKRFDLIYEPYGVSVYWNKPSSEAVYLPLGGGGQYQFPLGKETTLFLGAQFFKNVIRPTKGTVYDLRFLVEFVF
jgi:hypothetical protein